MKKLLSLGALGVLCLVGGVVLIISGFDAASGQVLAVVGVVLILVSVVVFPLAARWALFRTKGRAVLFGAGILGRIVGGLLLIVAIAVGIYLLT